MDERRDFPDFFGDSINVSAGPFGFTLTFFASDPLAGEEEGIPGSVVGRARISPELAAALVDILAESVAKGREARAKTVTKSSRTRSA